MNKKVNEIFKIANIHADRIKLALQHIGNLFPITASVVANMGENDLVWIELFVVRFGKLQDLIGAKLINIFLEEQQESNEQLTILDKINILEKLGIIESSELWKEMRAIRNHVAHEYPDAPELTAKYLNQLFNLTPQLLDILDKLKKKMLKEQATY